MWAANDLKPHRTRTFKLSNDPQFKTKFWDIVGLYLNPPTRALVLCCDEKSQGQALERTQPALPLGQGHIATRALDYYRDDTVTLFAALNYPRIACAGCHGFHGPRRMSHRCAAGLPPVILPP